MCSCAFVSVYHVFICMIIIVCVCVCACSSPVQCFPLKLFLLLTKQLSADDHWKNVGAALNLISVDEISYISSQKKKDYGEFVMERWKESSKLSVQDLFDALRNDGLTRLAEQVEKCMK